MTRAEWYAQHNGGGWRVARKPFICGQSLCLMQINSGEQYFDTQQKINYRVVCTQRICKSCANFQLQGLSCCIPEKL